MADDPRWQLRLARDEVRLIVGASCGETVGEMAADAIDDHADHEPWGWAGTAVICRACDEIVLPAPSDVLDQGALAWSR